MLKIPSFNGRINRKGYWLGLLQWFVSGLVVAWVIIAIVDVVHSDRHQPANWVNHIGAMLFLIWLAFLVLQVISLVVRRANDSGSVGVALAVLTLFFTPGILLLGLLPTRSSKNKRT